MINSNDIPLGAMPIERAAHRRRDEAWLEKALKGDDALVFLMREGLPCIEGKASGAQMRPGERMEAPSRPLFWMGHDALKLSRDARVLFMGEDKRGAPVFALDLPKAFDIDTSLIAGAAGFEDMRAAAGLLSPLEANLAATARSLTLWHDSHGFCARCGSPTGITDAGWKRECPHCGTEHFPRTDPVAIMIATRGEYALIGRQKMWPQGFWSALAGFCEPGETIEQCAAREIEEEAGIKCDASTAKYVACQPWPFPSSLMIAIMIEATSEVIRADTSEIEAAKWVSRDDLRKILQGQHDEIFAPPKTAIAHYLLAKFAFESD